MIQPAFTRMPGLALVLLMQALPLAAQPERDPTVAPPETGAAGLSPMGAEGVSVLVRDDRPYLVVGTRLYAPGDKVGKLRVERITETEVWLHDGMALIKMPRFAGITRKSIATKSRCGAPAPHSPPAAAPCEDTQP